MKLLLFLILLILPIADAMPIDFNVVKYEINEDHVKFINEIRLHLVEEDHIELNLPTNYEGLTVKLNGKDIEYSIKNNKINLDLNKESKILLIEYLTKNYLEEDTFITEFKNQLFSTFVFFELKLPKDSIIDTSYIEDNFYLDPEEIVLEKDYMLVKWKKENVNEGDITPLLVKYKEKEDTIYFVIPLLFIVGILSYFLLRFAKRFKRKF